MRASILCFLAYTARAYSLSTKSGLLKACLEQFSCYMQDGVLYIDAHIDAPDGRRQITLFQRKDDVFKEFLTAATELGSPNLCAEKYLEA